MTCKHPRPSWWLLYLLLPLMIGLLYLESQTPWTAGWHRAAQIGIVLITYDLVWLWLRANEGALLWEDLEKTSSNSKFGKFCYDSLPLCLHFYTQKGHFSPLKRLK